MSTSKPSSTAATTIPIVNKTVAMLIRSRRLVGFGLHSRAPLRRLLWEQDRPAATCLVLRIGTASLHELSGLKLRRFLDTNGYATSEGPFKNGRTQEVYAQQVFAPIALVIARGSEGWAFASCSAVTPLCRWILCSKSCGILQRLLGRGWQQRPMLHLIFIAAYGLLNRLKTLPQSKSWSPGATHQRRNRGVAGENW